MYKDLTYGLSIDDILMIDEIDQVSRSHRSAALRNVEDDRDEQRRQAAIARAQRRAAGRG